MPYLILVWSLLIVPIAFSQTICRHEFAHPAIALEPVAHENDGTIRVVIDYSTALPGRRVLRLPAVLRELVDQDRLRIVILAGNSGSEYADTRHNLAFAFGDSLLRAFPGRNHSTEIDYRVTDTVEVSYDDQSMQSWTTEFRTEKPRFRTITGEVFYYPDIAGAPVLVVKMIGDYNEIGDFAAPIIDGLRVIPARTLLVHDELQVAEGSLILRSGQTQKFDGNNAVFSIIRSLSYRAIDDVLQYLRSKVSTAEIDDETWRELVSSVRSRADIRSPSHLGNPKAYSTAFKNLGAITNAFSPVITRIENALFKPFNEMIETKRAELRVSKEPIGPLRAAMRDDSLLADERARLALEHDAIILGSKPVSDAIRDLENQKKDLHQELIDEVRKIVEERLRFATLAIGTDDGRFTEGGRDFARFVLAPYPSDVFTDAFWLKAQAEFARWLEGGGSQ